MYDAKQMIQQILKWSLDKDRQTRDIKRQRQLDPKGDFKGQINKVKKMGQRIQQQILALQ